MDQNRRSELEHMTRDELITVAREYYPGYRPEYADTETLIEDVLDYEVSHAPITNTVI